MAIEFSRRALIGAACRGAVGVALGQAAVARAAEVKKTELSPDQALAKLKEGNERFVADPAACFEKLAERRRRSPLAKRRSRRSSPAPTRACRPSLFGRGLGELFIIRDAGNTVDTVGLGSIQYAVEHLGVPLLVVLGHRRCGAVQAAIAVVKDNAIFPGSIGQMVEPIVPAVLKAQGVSGDLQNAVRENVRRTVTRPGRRRSRSWRSRCRAG